MNNSTQSDEKKKEVLQNTKTIAVVGLSDDPYKASHRVAKYLKDQGYKIIPVNPRLDQVLGEKSYPDLQSIPEKVDLVDVFRKEDELLEIIASAADAGIPAVWLQAGLVCNAGRPVADDAGMCLIDNCCMMVEHRRLIG